MTLLERFDRAIQGNFKCDFDRWTDEEVETVRRALAIAQAVDEWRPSPPHNNDRTQKAEADAKLRLLRRAEELLRGES